MAHLIAETSKCRKTFDLFIERFPMYKDQVKLYGPVDRKTIKITMKDHQIYVFNYVDRYDWGFQTYTNYLNSMATQQEGDLMRARI